MQFLLVQSLLARGNSLVFSYTTARFAPGAVIYGAVTSGKVTPSAVTPSAVISGAVPSGAVTPAAVTSGEVTFGEVYSGAVTSSAVISGAVTSSEVTSGAIFVFFSIYSIINSWVRGICCAGMSPPSGSLGSLVHFTLTCIQGIIS